MALILFCIQHCGQHRKQKVAKLGVGVKPTAKSGKSIGSVIKSQTNGQSKSSKVIKVTPAPDCTLELAVQNLIRLICDVKLMELAATEVEFDTKRCL